MIGESESERRTREFLEMRSHVTTPNHEALGPFGLFVLGEPLLLPGVLRQHVDLNNRNNLPAPSDAQRFYESGAAREVPL